MKNYTTSNHGDSPKNSRSAHKHQALTNEKFKGLRPTEEPLLQTTIGIKARQGRALTFGDHDGKNISTRGINMF